MHRRDRYAVLTFGAIGAALAALWIQVRVAGWQLVGDNAVITMRAGDVLHPGSPVLGMPSAFNAWAPGVDPFHPGPLVFWIFAPFVESLGPSVPTVLAATWLMALASTGIAIWAGGRRLGPHGALGAGVTAFALVPFAQDVWQPLNPVLVLLPALAVCFLTWCIAEGDGAAWPLLAGVSSLTVQADLAYLPSSLGLVALALWWSWRHRKRARAQGCPHHLTRRQFAATAMVVAVVWALPVGEAVVNGGGNVAEMLAAARADVPMAGLDRILLSAAPLGVAVALLGLPALIGWRAALPGRRTLAVTAGVGVVAAIGGQGNTPAAAGVHGLYRLPLYATTAFAVFALVVLAVDGFAVRGHSQAVNWARRGAIVVLVAVGLEAMLTASVDTEWLSEAFPAVQPLAQHTIDELPAGQFELRAVGNGKTVALGYALALVLERDGFDLRVQPPIAKYLGARRLVTGTEQGTLVVTMGGEGAPTGAPALVAQWRSDAAGGHEVASTLGDAARAVRAEPVEFDASASAHQVGSAVAGTGADPAWVVGLDDEGLETTGRRLLDDPRRVVDLSDESIVALLRAGVLPLPSEVSADALEQLERSLVMSVWLYRAER
jgi:hypothetical protein